MSHKGGNSCGPLDAFAVHFLLSDRSSKGEDEVTSGLVRRTSWDASQRLDPPLFSKEKEETI